ncbi:hypothetical protein A3H40_04450 [Candidatus Daviesbacteria bacterium RIFCSPLOWO2_02_FULL_38_15]|uniref:Peptidase S11 D-alanyl-D-alanine carboxypeptidase A N-terminal domain-containing protein n=1 Tax=Candidatus Daviesbacteria bacterium RIFCSPLOWO2_02_FULL_38_15 TaxID=1797794 RepID=A0A1F5N4A0_9BACT|nr:MAG: hypothetical protein A3H40_04450 [Candidatus Daviesbacteria bacterium RIFCSPLOWO2_02_FULL_38_15]
MKKVAPFLAVALIILFVIVLSSLPSKASVSLISPLLSNGKILGVNQWFPSSVLGVQTNTPKISAKGAIFIDTKKGEVLYSKNSQQRLPIASLVKVMAALIALEYKNWDDQFIVSKEAAEMEPDKMLLIAGERLSLKELLYGLFLISANDAAEVLAEGTTGSRQEFIRLMNDKAKQLGMTDSFFANPTGLDEDENNSYSTAYDLVILTRFLIRRFPEVADISKTEHIFLPQTETHQDYDMYSGINLLTTYPGVMGFKTGFTPQAGLTLITLARKNGHEVVGVLLGSASRRDEARELLDYSFKKLGN